MQKAAGVLPEESFFVLSSLSPGATQKKLALVVVLGIFVVAFAVAGPLASIHPGPIPAFVPFWATAMFVSDLITSILLFAQFSVLRLRALLVIATGYLFTALILIPFLLTFPNLFVSGSVMGGLSSTSALYSFWHTGFAVFVIIYAFSKDAYLSRRFWRGTVSGGIGLSVAAAAAIVTAVGFLCIAGESILPRLAVDRFTYSPLWIYYVGLPVLLLSIAAIVTLWIRRDSALDLWLLVVMCLFAVEVPLSYYPEPIRFSLGWYTVRVIGLISSGLILVVLLYEITTIYARLVGAISAERREREARLMTGDAVAAMIAHEVKQPLSGMITNAGAGLRFLDKAAPDLAEVKEAFQQIVVDGHRAGAVIGSIRKLFQKEARKKDSLDLNDLIDETLGVVREDLERRRILVQTELDEHLPQVIGDRILLQQVLVNLITNAIDSLSAVDGLRILSVRSKIQSDGDIAVSITDTGTGIGSQDINRVFNPLFTTKPDGMGMGLAICRSIIEAHDGRLWVSQNAPHGAVFHFALSQHSSA